MADATYHFQPASGGNIPAGAQPNGNEADPTEPLWVARTVGATPGLAIVQLGKVRPGLGEALFPFGGKEVGASEYEVLMEAGIWIDSDPSGEIPIGAVVCGEDADGAPLFVARATFNGGVHPGKVRFGFNGASIGVGGVEQFVTPYQILVTNDNALH
ncbi:MAG: DUF3421 domain-containing protein [Actinomycetota bacterium]|nr:DUF3421 domain-containing protein [Actinomycetota bacterium]